MALDSRVMFRTCVFTFTPEGDGGPESVSAAHRAAVSAPPQETFVTGEGGHAAVAGPGCREQDGVPG